MDVERLKKLDEMIKKLDDMDFKLIYDLVWSLVSKDLLFRASCNHNNLRDKQ